MESTFKRFLSLVLAFLMVVSYIPTSAFATEGTEDHTHDEIMVTEEETPVEALSSEAEETTSEPETVEPLEPAAPAESADESGEIDAGCTSHSYVDDMCTACGTITPCESCGQPMTREWYEANCTDGAYYYLNCYSCEIYSECFESTQYPEGTGHDFSQGTSCSKCGYVDPATCSHEYDKWGYCSICSTYSPCDVDGCGGTRSWEYTTVTDCTKEVSYVMIVCDVCENTVITDNAVSTIQESHDFSWHTHIPATCSEPGRFVNRCQNCTMYEETGETAEPASGRHEFDTEGNCTMCGINEADIYYFAIGEVSYNDFQSAIDAAASGDTIRMILDFFPGNEDCEGKSVLFMLEEDDKITLDLNGHTLAGRYAHSEDFAFLENNGELTIMDGTNTHGSFGFGGGNPGGTGVACASDTIVNNGKLTLVSGLVGNSSVDGYNAHVIVNQSGAELTVSGGNVNGNISVADGSTFSITAAGAWFQPYTEALDAYLAEGLAFGPVDESGSACVVTATDPDAPICTCEVLCMGTANAQCAVCSENIDSCTALSLDCQEGRHAQAPDYDKGFTPATCVTDGAGWFKCNNKNCTFSEYRELPANGLHNYGEDDLCTVCQFMNPTDVHMERFTQGGGIIFNENVYVTEQLVVTQDLTLHFNNTAHLGLLGTGDVLKVNEDVTLTLNGTEVTGVGGIENYGTVNVCGVKLDGVFISPEESYQIQNYGTVNFYSGTYRELDVANSEDAIVMIYGGSYLFGDPASPDDLQTALEARGYTIADGFVVGETDENGYTAVIPDSNYEAMIGEAKYATLEDAFAAAAEIENDEDRVIQVLHSAITIENTITIDVEGSLGILPAANGLVTITYTGTGTAFVLKNGHYWTDRIGVSTAGTYGYDLQGSTAGLQLNNSAVLGTADAAIHVSENVVSTLDGNINLYNSCVLNADVPIYIEGSGSTVSAYGGSWSANSTSGAIVVTGDDNFVLVGGVGVVNTQLNSADSTPWAFTLTGDSILVMDGGIGYPEGGVEFVDMNSCVLSQTGAEAKVNNRYYGSLETAMGDLGFFVEGMPDASQGHVTVQLLDDVTISESVATPDELGSLEVNLGEHKVTSTADQAFVLNNANIVIHAGEIAAAKNCVEAGTSVETILISGITMSTTDEGGSGTAVISSAGAITVESVYLGGDVSIAIDNDATLTMGNENVVFAGPIQLNAKDAALVAVEGLTVTSGIKGYKVQYGNGVYVLVEFVPEMDEDGYFLVNSVEELEMVVADASQSEETYIRINWSNMEGPHRFSEPLNIPAGTSITLDITGKELMAENDATSNKAALIVEAGASLKLEGQGCHVYGIINSGNLEIDVMGDIHPGMTSEGIEGEAVLVIGTNATTTISGGSFYRTDSGTTVIKFYNTDTTDTTISGGSFGNYDANAELLTPYLAEGLTLVEDDYGNAVVTKATVDLTCTCEVQCSSEEDKNAECPACSEDWSQCTAIHAECQVGQHDFQLVEGTSTPATCITAGSMQVKCSRDNCGAIMEPIIPATGEHTYVDGECSVCHVLETPVEDIQKPEITVSDSVKADNVEQSVAESIMEEVAANTEAQQSYGLEYEANESVISDAKEVLQEQGATDEEVADAQTKLSITLTEVIAEDDKPTEVTIMTYDVQPQLIAGDHVVDIDNLDAAITFRLPIPRQLPRRPGERAP